MNISVRFFDGQTDWDWVQKHNPIKRVEDTNGLVAINKDTGELVAACILYDWSENSVYCHTINTASRAEIIYFMTECFDYIFNYRGIKMVFGTIPSHNKKALKAMKSYGGEVACVLEKAWEDGFDVCLVMVKKENCKFLPQVKISEGE